MAGRRLHSRGEIQQRLIGAVEWVDQFEADAELQPILFSAWNLHNARPAAMQDIEQATSDVRETLDILAGLDMTPLLKVAAFHHVLTEVSAREHIIAMPGPNREQRRHPSR